MNPLENLWGYLVNLLSKAHDENGRPLTVATAANADELFRFVNAAWQDLNDNVTYLESLVDSMPSRMRAVIEANGGWTHY